MSAEALKLSITQLIENENDEVVLKAIKDVVKSIVSIKKKQIVGYSVDGEPITGAELEKECFQLVKMYAKARAFPMTSCLNK